MPRSKYLLVTYVLIATLNLCNKKTMTLFKELTGTASPPTSLTGGFYYKWILVPPKEKGWASHQMGINAECCVYWRDCCLEPSFWF